MQIKSSSNEAPIKPLAPLSPHQHKHTVEHSERTESQRDALQRCLIHHPQSHPQPRQALRRGRRRRRGEPAGTRRAGRPERAEARGGHPSPSPGLQRAAGPEGARLTLKKSSWCTTLQLGRACRSRRVRVVLPPLVTLRRERAVVGERPAHVPRGAAALLPAPSSAPLRQRRGEGSGPGAPAASRRPLACPAPRLLPADADDEVHGASGSRPARLLFLRGGG